MPIEPEPPEFSSPPLLDAAATDGVAAQAAEPHHPGHVRHTHCQNCGTPLAGPFCAQCGQHDLDFHQSFGHVLMEALENLFHFDAKLFRNILTLLFRPGQLSADFNAGRRAAQMPPFRLYLFISVLFFFSSFLGGDRAVDPDVPPPGNTPAATAEHGGKPKTNGLHLQVNEKRDTAWERFLSDQGKYALLHEHEMTEAFLHALPKMLLLCLPFMALYTRVLFRRSGQVYLQHLIIAIHYHTFVYLWWLVAHGWKQLVAFGSPGVAGLLGFAAGVWMAFYPFFMLRRLFAETWLRTSLKTLALAATYALTIALGFLLTAAVVFVTL